MKVESKAELVEFIKASFPCVSPPGEVIEHFCDECLSLQNAFKGKTWTEVSDNTIVENYDKLPLFTPEAFAFYVPAFMTYALGDPAFRDEIVREFLVYSFSPSNDPGSKSFWNLRKAKLSAEQCTAICTFLNTIRLEDETIESDVVDGLKFFDCKSLTV